MNAFAGIRPKGGRNPTPLAFSLALAVGVICFPVGVQPPQPPPIFTLPGSDYTRLKLVLVLVLVDVGLLKLRL